MAEIGVILAGGRSSRMGSDKAAVAISDRTMIDWVATALHRVVDRVVVVGRTSTTVDADVMADPGPSHQGPLAGLAAVAATEPDANLVVVAVDQPWVRDETLRHLIDRTDRLPVVPVDEHGVRQTTCAVYPSNALDDIEGELTGGGSVQSLLDRVSFDPVVAEEWRSWGEDGRSWFSVDRPEDIETGRQRYGDLQPPM